mmetsp:Transcript_28972/g.43735  ORF Transcript_28972/g.43735 Transcript_28972/m.43735 type:complete len:90 (-) Transcript_28972:1810-2079(-)
MNSAQKCIPPQKGAPSHHIATSLKTSKLHDPEILKTQSTGDNASTSESMPHMKIRTERGSQGRRGPVDKNKPDFSSCFNKPSLTGSKSY